MRRAALIYNPKSGRQRHARRLDGLTARLRAGGYTIDLAPTGGPGQATGLARSFAAAGLDAVFSYGGDGTAREVAAGLLGTSVPLGLIPGGTANVLALALGLPLDPFAAAEALAGAVVRPFDVGLAGSPDAEHPFLMMVSAGLDAAILDALDVRLKWRFGKAAFVWQGAREWWRYGYPALTVEADGEILTGSFAAVANIPFYGGPIRLAPDARTDDGRFELVVFRGRGRRATLGFMLDLVRGAHLRRPDVILRQVEEATFTAPAGAPAQVDGDLCAAPLPLQVHLAPARLRVLFPPSSRKS